MRSETGNANRKAMEQPQPSAPRPAEHRGRGIALRIGGLSLFAAMMAAFKYASLNGTNPAEILFYRNFFSFPTILLWVLVSGGFASVRTNRPGAHAARSGLGLAVMLCTFLALSMLPLAEATVINFSAPLFATLLSALFLKERVLWHRWGAIVVGLAGVLIVVRPGGASLPALGVAIALMAAMGAATVTVTLRQIGQTESATATVFWFNTAGLIATALPMPFLFQFHTPAVWVALTLGGLLGGIAQIMITASVRYAPVSALAPFDYLQIVWAMIWGLVLFDTFPAWSSIIGAALIGAAGCYVIWRERKARTLVVPSPNEL